MLRRISPQPLTALVVCSLAVAVLAWSWAGLLANPSGPPSLQTGLLTLFLAGAVVGAGLYPIHVRHNTKVSLTTPALYIMALLLPVPIAALAAGVSVLLKMWLRRSKTGNRPSDIATDGGRWVLVAFLSACVAHWGPLQSLGMPLVLLATALVMFAGDVVTVAFEIAPMCGVPPRKIMAGVVRDGGLSEAVQYLLGMLGAMAALKEVWALALVAIPAVIAYRVFKSMYELQDHTRAFLEGMADAVDLRDPYTGGHSRRVAEWCSQILGQMNTVGAEADLIVASARVHDIGKIGIPDAVLMKPDRLGPEKSKQMQSHTEKGPELLSHHRDFRARRRGGALASRTLGRRGLPGWACWLRHPLWRTRDRGGGRLRRHDIGQTVSHGDARRAGDCRFAAGTQPAV